MNDLGTNDVICAETVPPWRCPMSTIPFDCHHNISEVYFLYFAGFIKIGMSKKAVKRMAAIQLVLPLRAQIVFLVKGGRRTEEYFHYVFREYHMGGEWFELGA